ncbi:threonine--tRNA ligase [Candidatus Woesearchaeota archaeon]|nr:threonine--tRNA ligase [Candidatus Woesearchaeota archaeon]
MSQMKIKLDGKEIEVKKGISGEELIAMQGLKDVIALEIDNKLVDLSTTITTPCTIKTITLKDQKGMEIFWHSSAHVLAAAVRKLYPNAKPTIGPPIENGFYYDFADLKISEEDLEKIEKEALKIIESNAKPERRIVSKEEALELFKDNKYKKELIEEFSENGEELTVYDIAGFIDLCRGPHLPSIGLIKAFKVLKTSGAYWRGDANNEQLTRIYGISFPSREELKQYLKQLEEAEKRDHRKIARQLELFSIHEEGPGFPFWHPKGYRIYRALEEYMRELLFREEYLEVKTPMILNKKLWLQSGHWDHYKENMYFTKIDNEEYAVKPMNCPGHILIYKTRVHSYKEFPLRMAEFGLVHRHELSGVLSGLFRVRCFTQDDAHIFCREDQIKQEIRNILRLINEIYSTLGFKYKTNLSTRPEDYMGRLELWNKAEQALKEALKEEGMSYEIKEGEGAFYGPKIDFEITDALGREWQCATIQLDFQMPERFDLTYMGEDGTMNHRPVMIHRAIYGSLERFIGILIEHFAGKMPLWLSPEHVRIIPVADRHLSYAEKIRQELKKNKFYATIDDRDASLNKKIREAQLEKVNYIVVVGDKEVEEGTVNIRARDNKFQLTTTIEKFIEGLRKEREEKILEAKKEYFE